MAEENIVTNIVANADFSGLIADVNKVTASLSKLQQELVQSDARLASQIAAMNRSFGENLRRTGQFSSHFVTLTSDVEKFGKNLDSGKLKLKQYYQAFQDHAKTSGGLIRQLAQQQVQLQNAILQPLGKNAQGLQQFNVHIPQGLDAVKNKTALARQELQIMNKVIQDGGVQMINWGKNTQWAGRQLTVGLTVPLAAFGKAAADAFRAADTELTRLTKVYGGIAATSAQDLAKIRSEVASTARDLASTYGASFKDTISLAADIAATGKQGNELLGSLKETTRLAVLGEVDKQQAMKATLAIQTTFKQNTTQLADSINFLNAVENQTSTSLQDLTDAIPKAGTVVQAMGGSVKDLALYLTAMKEGGVNAAEGANAIKSSLASLINPTAKAVGMFKSFGIDLKGIVSKNAGDLTGTILSLQAALDQLNPLQKQQAIEQLFGKFQFARMNALFANLGKQGSQTLQVLDLMKASSADLANIASRELSQVTESASGKYKRAVESLKADLAGIGESFLKVQTFFIKVTDSIVKFVNHLPGPIKQVLTFVTGLTAIIGPVIMLTGVLANFFGYIIKGASHFRSLFKGGEGWKMLTPEILAAQKAGNLVEQTFYSDAKAAHSLKSAIQELIAEFQILQDKANSNISLTPAMTTLTGDPLQFGGRVVNPNSPYISPKDTRSFSHLNPVAGMSINEKARQTIFSTVPGAPLVNQKISNNPQMYVSGDIAKVEGASSIKGVSTGIVAEEAAKWHAMTGALAMQSEAEIKKLKTEIAATGLITTELSDSYNALLPKMTEITSNAAKAAAVIVEDLRADKISAAEARAKIIALNSEIESMLAGAAIDIAGQQGRSINLTSVPLTNQPIVDMKTGKSNMKEITKAGRTREILNKIAGNLGVKTFGAGYSTETTMPKRFASGGVVYRNQGSYGPEFKPMGTDTVPAMLTEGEFVVNAQATKDNLPLLQAINSSSQSNNTRLIEKPTESGFEHKTSGLTGEEVSKIIPNFRGKADRFYTLKGTSGLYIGDVTDPEIVNMFGTEEQKKAGRITRVSINNKMKTSYVPGQLMAAALKASRSSNRGSTEQFLTSIAKAGVITAEEAKQTADLIYNKYIEKMNMPGVRVNDSNNNYWTLANAAIRRNFGTHPEVNNLWSQFSAGVGAHTGDTTLMAGSTGASTSHLAQILTTSTGEKINVGTLRGSAGKDGSLFAHAAHSTPFLKRFSDAGLGVFRLGTKLARGAYTPGAYKGYFPRRYANGGMVGGVQYHAAGGLIGNLAMAAGIPILGNMLGSQIGGSAGSTVSTLANFLPFILGGMGGFRRSGTPRVSANSSPLNIQDGQIIPGPIPRQEGFISSRLPDAFSKQIGPATKLTGIIEKGALGGGRFANVLKTMALGATRLNVITGVLTTAAIIGYKAWKNHQEALRLNALGYGLTSAAAAKAGLKYVDYNQKIKDSIQLAKDLKEKNKLIYESMANSGTPLNMTIEQYKKLKEEVKSVYSDQIKLIDQTKTGQLGSLAVRMKEEFIAAGMSAEDATKKIYAMFQMSNKANYASSSTVGNKSFTAITDAQSAAKGAVETYGAAAKTQGGQAQAAALNTALTGLDGAISAAIAKSEKLARQDQTGNTKALTEYQAQKQVIDDINQSKMTGVKLTQDTINELAKENPEILKVANTQDTVISLWQKQRLLAQGYLGDLSKLSAAEVNALSTMANIIQQGVVAANSSKGGLLATQYANLKNLTDQQKSLQKAAQGQSVQSQIDSRTAIKALQDQIDKTNKLADARIKAIEVQKADADLARQIESKRLDIQNAQATGNTAAAQQAQLDLEGLVKQQQADSQIKAIQKAAEKANTPLQAKIDALNNANQAMSDKAALAGENLGTLSTKIQTQQGKIDAVNTAMSQWKLNLDASGKTAADFLKTKIGEGLAAAITQAYKDAGGKVDPKANPAQQGLDIFNKSGADAQIVANGDIYINSKKLVSGKGETPVAPKEVSVQGPKGETHALAPMASNPPTFKTQAEASKAKSKTFVDSNGATWNLIVPAKTPAYWSSGNWSMPAIKAGYGLNNAKAGMPIIVGDRGPEVFFPKVDGSIAPDMISAMKFASPSFNIPSNSLMPAGMTPQGGGGDITITQNIYPSPDMNTDAFVRQVVAQTTAVLGKSAKIDTKMVGQGRSV